MPRTSQLRPQILESALAILSEEGLEGLHARSIAARLNINHASVHYYYKSRADLLTATASHAAATWSEALSKSQSAKDGESLRSHLGDFADLMESGHQRVLIALLAAAPSNPGVAEALQKFATDEAARLNGLVDKTRSAEVRVRKGPLRQGSYLLGALIGNELLRLIDGQNEVFQTWPGGFSDALID